MLGRPAQPASPVPRRNRALDRRAERADHHKRRNDAGADDLRRDIEAVVGFDRLAVPIQAPSRSIEAG